MERREQSLLSLIFVPAIISNLVTLARLGLELAGFGPGLARNAVSSDPVWWVSLSLLIPVFGVYFAFKLRDAARPYRRLLAALYLYGLSVRIPTAIVYGLSGALGWQTHYSIYGPPGTDSGYVLGGLVPQLVLWPIITVIGGALFGIPALLLLRSGRVRAASA